MEEKNKKSTYYELMSPKELVEKLCNEISKFFENDKICGTLTIPSNYPKELQNRIEDIALLSSCLKYKIYKEGENNTII